ELVLVIMGLLTVAMLAASIGRNLPVPCTVFLVVIGMVLAALADNLPALAPLQNFELTPDLVFFIFLPALIFESALTLDARQLLKDIAPIFVLAAPALVVSTALIGFGVSAYMGLDLTLALLFGALIAATDPVAVVALFKELGAPARLTTLVEGESLFNDATAIVVFHILLGIALAGTFTTSDIGHAAIEFVRVFFGGVLVGAFIGFGISELMRRIRGSELAIPVMSFVMAYSSFVIAEHVLHVSGVMAAVAAAVSMGLFAITRIPRSALQSIHETSEVIALVCNSLLFLMIGLSVDVGLLINNLDGIIVAALLVLVARAAAVYTLVPATTRLFSLPHVNMGERHIMWWGGLKGGLAIAIVLAIPEPLDGRQTLVELTLGVVLLTLLINAPSIRPLIAWFGLDRMSEEENAELRRGLLEAQQQAHAVVERLSERSAPLLCSGSRATASVYSPRSITKSPRVSNAPTRRGASPGAPDANSR
ncbi:MAG: cation:proton antiporter, partial [Gammaproteobacteria bacterium]